ncbi:MAG: hypothetical protein KBC41_00185 [Candidatus Pacebacteria bacterium]|nr:hypothetical protein [Candidatus Paceibacterota bacterium]MBP9866485.1 hypothetical protein [Candidatus Paceibacterota bacterium]
MLTSKKTESLTLHIPTFGECTLLSFDVLPDTFRIYTKLLITAKELDLCEFPELSRVQIQEIFKALAHRISGRGVATTEGVSVLISGMHLSFPSIDITNKNQEPEECITSMEFFFWEHAKLTKSGDLRGGPVDMQLDEISIYEYIPIMGEDSAYCLFIGT